MGREQIALRVGHAPDDTFEAQTAQIIGELARGVLVMSQALQISHLWSQAAVRETLGRREERSKRRHAEGEAMTRSWPKRRPGAR